MEEEEKEDEGWWMGVSFRPALTFSHTPARSPLAPESSREPNLALLRSPPPLSVPVPPFGAVHRATSSPRVPIPCGSSERMFCHHTTPHAAPFFPNSPSSHPGLLASTLPLLPPDHPSRRPPSAPRRRGRYTRNHVHTSNFRFRYPKCSLCTCTYTFRRQCRGRASFRRLCVHEYACAYDDAGRRQSAPMHALKCTLASACRFAGISLIQGWCFFSAVTVR